jgi:hypothetical protein
VITMPAAARMARRCTNGSRLARRNRSGLVVKRGAGRVMAVRTRRTQGGSGRSASCAGDDDRRTGAPPLPPTRVPWSVTAGSSAPVTRMQQLRQAICDTRHKQTSHMNVPETGASAAWVRTGPAGTALNRHGAAFQGAERVGFEPTVALPRQRLSRAPHSATLAPLRGTSIVADTPSEPTGHVGTNPQTPTPHRTAPPSSGRQIIGSGHPLARLPSGTRGLAPGQPARLDPSGR